MGITKSEIFSEEQNRIASLLKAMAHPARIAILQHLIQKQSCVCGTLVEELGLAQATTSQHLKALKSVGLIQGTIEGTSVCYCIEPKAWELLKKDLQIFMETYTPDNNCC